jgi:hypothetical protein
MRRRLTGQGRAARVLALPGVCAAVVLLVGCGSSHPRSPPANTVPESGRGTLKVSPAQPGTHSTVAFGFTAPVSSGVHGTYVIQYSLSITGTGASGCVAAHEAVAGRAAAGDTATITVGPSQLGRPWCAGLYSARVIELQRAHCTDGAPCPRYIRVVRIVARTTFELRRA